MGYDRRGNETGRVISFGLAAQHPDRAGSLGCAVLPPAVRARLAVEAGAAQGWHRYVGDAGGVLSVERFGASAPGEVVLREYGLTVDQVCKRAQALRR
jgi:transketolase